MSESPRPIAIGNRSPFSLKSFSECLVMAGDRKTCHVLLGNGFSIACRKDVFSYTSLYESANFAKYSDKLKLLFEALETKDFEVVMDALEKSISTLKIYNENSSVETSQIKADYESLRKLLVETLTAHHPKYPDEISEAEYGKCKKFLSNFERIYTLNYDLLLYWTLMGMDSQKDDGFRDPFSGEPDEYYEENYVAWFNNDNTQRVFYMHGALHLFMSEFELKKYSWRRRGVKLIEQVEEALNSGKFPLVVSESNSEGKLAKIQRSSYLGHAYRSISKIGGSLFIYGHSLDENDNHILNQIRMNKKLKNVFISIYGDISQSSNNKIVSQGQSLKMYRGKDTKKQIVFFDASTANVWSD